MGMINATSGHLCYFDEQRYPDVAFIIPMLHQNNQDVLM
jgi:hypothetical protein